MAEGGAKIFGVFRVENHDFTPKNHIFSNFRGGRAPGAPPPGSAPGISKKDQQYNVQKTHNNWATRIPLRSSGLSTRLKLFRSGGRSSRFRVMVFNATFSNISAISWRSVLLVVIGTDCISSCKSIYHTITTTTVFILHRYQSQWEWYFIEQFERYMYHWYYHLELLQCHHLYYYFHHIRVNHFIG